MRYLLFSGLFLGSRTFGQAQGLVELPANLQVRQHKLYAGVGLGSIANLERVTSNGPLYQAQNLKRGISVGGRLGYIFSPTLAAEIGICGLQSQSSYRINPLELYSGGTENSTRNLVYLAAYITGKLWQPTSRLTVRGVVGGGLLIWPEKSGFYDNTRISVDSVYFSPARKFTTHYTGSEIRNSAVIEFGLRADWRLGRYVVFGLGIMQQQSLAGSLQERSITVTDSYDAANTSTVKFESRLRSTSISVNTSFLFGSMPKYRYQTLSGIGE